MQNKIVGVFDPSYAEDNRVKKSRVYMNRLVEDALGEQSNYSKSFCEQKDPIKALEELFMGMKTKSWTDEDVKKSDEFCTDVSKHNPHPTKETEGIKHNEGKPQLSLLFTQFPKALEAIVKCSEYGHKKYNKNGEDADYLNFKRVEGGSIIYADAGLRHRLYKKGTTDLDSQLPHAYHVAWNALAELELILENKFGSLK
jgi:hypothetical protein